MTNICAECSKYFTNPRNIKTKVYCSLKCKKSVKNKRSREKYPNRYKEYQNKWRKNHPNYYKEWYDNNIKKRRITISKSYKKWKDNNPEKLKAHKLVFTAVRNKTLIKGICFCGNEKVEAHHEDYSKPLDVIWVCKKHHIEMDILRRQREELSTR